MISLKESADGQGDDPQVVFERINSTGEDLTLADLIRNYVLMTDKNRESLFENYWIVMENNLGKDNLVDYFMNYLTFKLPEQVPAKTAYQYFKKYVECNKLSNQDILEDLKKYSKYYNVFIREDSSYSKEINNLLEAFRNLQQSTIYPFFFSVFNDYEEKTIDHDEMIRLLMFFLNYTIRRMVTGVPSNSLRGLYKTLYKRIFAGTDKSDYFNKILKFMTTLNMTKDAVPNDTSFKEGLMYGNIYKNSKMCKYILTILENGTISAKESVIVDSSITIEHIMPQNKNEYWEKEIGPNYYAIHEKFLHTLGNLTLTGYNSELSDKSFTDKKNMILSKSKFVSLNSDVINQDKWSEASIVHRAERLSSILISCFKLPSIITETKVMINQSNKHTVMDGFDLTNTTPSSFILLGESVKVTSYRELLKSAMSLLYSLDSKKMETLARNNFKIPDATRVYITYNMEQKNAAELEHSGIYIETNLSANNIMSFIRAVLSEFNLSDEDFIFFVENN